VLPSSGDGRNCTVPTQHDVSLGFLVDIFDDRTMEHLAKSVDTSWELLPSKLSVDGTPLEDEDAGTDTHTHIKLH